MAVYNHLPSSPDRADETAAADDVVEASFEQLQQHVAGIALATARFHHISAELLLHDAVVVAEFLLLGQANAIVLRPSVAKAMHARGVELTPSRMLRDVRDRDADAAGQFDLGTDVPSHTSAISNTPEEPPRGGVNQVA